MSRFYDSFRVFPSLNVLVACEESQRTTIAFRELGHNAFSCDLQPCSGGHPEWHINGDVLPLLSSPCSFLLQDGSTCFVPHWDILIAHPPCTYLSRAGSVNLYRTPTGDVDPVRFNNGLLAASFFLVFLNSSIPHICVENPIPDSRWNLPPYSQIVEPYYFGDNFRKKTCLWLKNLPFLVPTSLVHPSFCPTFLEWFSKGSTKKRSDGNNSRAIYRSKTFLGMASAFADQFSRFVLCDYSV